jgi:hypothetical protein
MPRVRATDQDLERFAGEIARSGRKLTIQGCSTLLIDGQAEQIIDPPESGPVAVLVDGVDLVGP